MYILNFIEKIRFSYDIEDDCHVWRINLKIERLSKNASCRDKLSHCRALKNGIRDDMRDFSPLR